MELYDISIGARVKHPTLGVGVVYDIDAHTIHIFFREHGEKPIARSFEDLVIIAPGAEIGAAELDIDSVKDALREVRGITNFEGRRRQMQFIGKLMRQLDPAQHEAIRAALQSQRSGPAADTALLHEAEGWRESLLADDGALGRWCDRHPQTDVQQLRALIRQVRKDTQPSPAGQAPRHGKAYRELFQVLRAQLSPPAEAPTDIPTAAD